MRMHRLILLLALLPARPTAADPHSPEAERASFQVAEGFEVELFASEADGVVKPIQIRFDALGRLWVAGSATYPALRPGEDPRDRVLILEDRDRDGRCDEVTEFASGFYVPSGLEVTGDAGACYLGDGTRLLYLQDTDGDGRADLRETVFRGFGTGDNHQNINSFRWSPAGEIWFCQGLHGFARVETPHGVEKLDEAGMWRFRPADLRLEGYFGGPAEPQNPWGFVFTRWGDPLELAGNNHSIIYPVPGLAHRDIPSSQPLIWKGGGGRKMSGGELVETAHFPDDWQGRLIIGGYLNNAVWSLTVSEDGGGFSLQDAQPLIVSSHQGFRPVDVRFGPDGALYICDWFNPVIGHYQASYKHPERDRTRGRIWRVTARGRGLTHAPRLLQASTPELVTLLEEPDAWTREFARRVLSVRPRQEVSQATVTAHREASALLASTPERLDHLRSEMLGVLQGHLAVAESRPLLQALAASPVPGARCRAAFSCASHLPRGAPADEGDFRRHLLEKLAADPHPRVRVNAVIACTYLPDARSAEIALLAAEGDPDPFLARALDQAIQSLRPHWLPALQAGELRLSGPRLARLLQGDANAESLQALRALLGNFSGPPEASLPLWEARLLSGEASDFAAALDSPDLPRLLPLLARAATRQRPELSPARRDRLLALAGEADHREPLLRLAAAWRLSALLPLARSAPASPAAAEALLALEPEEALQQAAGLFTQGAGDAALQVWIPAVFARSQGPDQLLAALDARQVDPAAAAAALRIMAARGLNHDVLAERLQTAAGRPVRRWTFSPQFASAVAEEAKSTGDVEHGRQVYQRPELACIACHEPPAGAVSIGPPLSSLGSAQPPDLILGSILAPQKEVKEGYHALEITTRDGAVHVGYRAGGQGDELLLRMPATGEILRLPRRLIASERELGSLMPDGLADSLTREELRDLVSYLASRRGPASEAR